MNRAVLGAIALLVLGAAAGITADRLLHRQPDRRSALLARVQEDPLRVMHEELNLRPEQRERIAAILERHQSDIDSAWADTHVRLRTTVDSMVNEIAAVLDPDQAQKFRTLAAEVHASPGMPAPRRHHPIH